MFSHLDPITEGLTVERKEEMIEGLAKKIIDKGLVTPAIIFLESVKPVARVGSYTFLLFSAPLLEVVGVSGYEYTSLFKDRENIESLMRKIEELNKSQGRT